ncbi:MULTISPECIES: large conductance mechanosensitive channel protein MscL [unclassified Agrococcus]|uniref:large conductance mechanosensitive channel protein MscL n=1 Tax=unclassified Agrococcus TaxID=2615065 RepID=UPI00360E0FE1
MQGFKEFILRGNVVELAVAVVIGTAFTNIVTQIVEGVINPIITAIAGQNDFSDVEVGIIKIGLVIGAVINFLIVAAVVYFAMVMPMAKFKERQAKRRGTTEEAAKETDVDVLQDIRELLRQQQVQATPPTTKA